jgi:ABC-type transport system substrate-binding protein
MTMPTISADGLTWTFTLRAGLHYAPPLADTPIVAGDFKRALTRVAILGSRAAYADEFFPIEGFEAVEQGGASSITGLYVPNDRTLEVRLDSPTADLGYRLALPAAAPIPPGARETELLGAATGHDDDYGAFLVSSGPYMYEGADQGSFPAAPVDVGGAGGITLVRNPSWDAGRDPLRPAYVDQLHISTVAEQPSVNAALVSQGLLDFQFEEQSTASQATFDTYLSDPSTSDHAFAWPLDDTWAITMNVAVPPFDDPYIRRAVGLAFNEQGALGVIRISNAGSSGLYTTGAPLVHIVPDALEQGRLSDFDPFLGKKGPDRRSRADNSIDKSTYEHPRDGDCIDPLCRDISIAVYDRPPFPSIADSLRRDLKAVGIVLQETNTPFEQAFDPTNHVGLVVGPPWIVDYPNASRSFLPLTNEMITSTAGRNFSMVGATAAQLDAFGYPPMEVPGIDDRFGLCPSLTAAEQVGCWTLLDKYLMTTLVPWVPYLTSTLTWVDAPRVHGVVQDPLSRMAALEQIWISSDPSPSS